MVFTHALICFHKTNERVQRASEFCENKLTNAKYHTKALPMNKFVYFIDTEFFYIHSTNTSNLSFHETLSVSFDNNRIRTNQQREFILS